MYKRDYKKESRYDSQPHVKKKRANRNAARRKMMKYQGNADGVVVDGTGASAKQMQKLTTDERKILYNMLEGDVKYKVTKKKLQELSKNSRDLITQTGQIYKDLGLIGEETFQKNKRIKIHCFINLSEKFLFS